MAGESRKVGARGYAFHAGTAMPEYAEPLVPDAEFLTEAAGRGPWTLTEWDGTQWVHVATVSERSELERWLAGEPREL